MKVLVLGGSGYIGTAVVERLRAAGHRPVVLARKPDRAPEGVPARTGDLTDPDRLRAILTPDIDAVVHAATPTGNWDTDLAALAVMTDALAGRTLVYLSGVWVLGATTDPVDESAPANPIEIVSGRPRLEDHVLDATKLRGVVIRPGIVHGAGGGIPGMMIDWARAARTGRYVGEPTVRWPMVHRDDLADLVVLAVDRAPAGNGAARRRRTRSGHKGIGRRGRPRSRRQRGSASVGRARRGERARRTVRRSPGTAPGGHGECRG